MVHEKDPHTSNFIPPYFMFAHKVRLVNVYYVVYYVQHSNNKFC